MLEADDFTHAEAHCRARAGVKIAQEILESSRMNW